LANIYQPLANGLPKEQLQLALVSSRPLRQVKGDFISLLRHFYIRDITIEPTVSENTGSITIAKTKVGILQVENGLTIIQVSLAKLLSLIKTHPEYQPLPKTASVIEQLTFTLPAKTTIGPILQDIAQLSPKIKTVSLDSIYQHNYTFTIEYWSAKQNLTNEKVGPIRKRIVKVIEKIYQAKLVGKL
jgi:hypothetical protein